MKAIRRRHSFYKTVRHGILGVLCVSITTGIPASPLFAPPANDRCANAEEIPAGGPFPFTTTLTGDITDATAADDPAPASPCTDQKRSRSIWYKFKPATTATYYIESCNPGTGTTVTDTILAVFTASGGCTAPYVEMACGDDRCAKRGAVWVHLIKDVQYYIVVWKKDNAAPAAGAKSVELKVTPKDVNEYAQECKTALNAGDAGLMPEEVLPDDSCGAEIPIYWNQKRVKYKKVDAGGNPDPAGVAYEYVFDDGGTFKKGVANTFPDSDNTTATGRIAAKADLKCDYWSLINQDNGCVPDQRVLQREEKGPGGKEVLWTFIFRRTQPAIPGQANWDEFHPFYFNVMDVNALNPETGAVCWFDTLVSGTQVDLKGACSNDATRECDGATPCAGGGTCTNPPPQAARKTGMTQKEWWKKGKKRGIPRPGGSDAQTIAAALEFWDPPGQLVRFPGGPCTGCHGNGPFVSNRWINKDNRKRVSVRDDGKPYWNAGGLMENLTFFETAKDAKGNKLNCGQGCHRLWAREAATCPGGTVAEIMTRSPLNVLTGTPAASRWRKNESVAIPANRDTSIMFEMPDPGTGGSTPANWDNDFKDEYEAMKACCQDRGNCTKVIEPTVPFSGSESETASVDHHGAAEAQPDLVLPGQHVRVPIAGHPPREGVEPSPHGDLMGAFASRTSRDLDSVGEAGAFTARPVECKLDSRGSEICSFRLEWDDPADVSRRPAGYVLEIASVADSDPSRQPTTSEHCAGGTPAGDATFQAEDSPGGKRHEAVVDVPACASVSFRVCGTGAVQPARTRGRTTTLRTPCERTLSGRGVQNGESATESTRTSRAQRAAPEGVVRAGKGGAR